MKFLSILFVFVMYSAALLLIASSGTVLDPPDFPVFETPEVTFIDTSGGCAGFFDCTEYVGAVLYNIGAGIVFAILMLVAVLRLIVDYIVFVTEFAVSGFEDAPWWINIALIMPFLVGLGLIIYRLIRSGASED